MRSLTASPDVLSLRETRTYFLAMLFVVGNMVLPQLCHMVPQGGLILLPIYFFTLVAAWHYGIYVGLLTGILSPMLNYLLWGMPPLPVLPEILFKSIALAVVASFVASRTSKVSLLALLAVVLAYQIIGTAFSWLYVGNIVTALQDFRLGVPGMLLQVFGGYIVLSMLLKTRSPSS